VGTLPRRKKGPDVSTLLIYAVILFLALKFLGITKEAGIDPFGSELDLMAGVAAAGFYILHGEIKSLRIELGEVSDKLSAQGERIARLEAVGETKRTVD